MHQKEEVVLRVKSKGNKIGASVLSRLNKMGNPTQILKKINALVAGLPEKKALVSISLTEDRSVDYKILYPGDAQILRTLPPQSRSLSALCQVRNRYGHPTISQSEYNGIIKSIS